MIRPSFSWILAVAASSATAQQPARSVSLGFGVDTAIVEVRDIVGLTRAYLQQPDSTARTRELWSGSPDLAVSAYQGFPATILGVTELVPGDSVFVVKVLHASGDSSGQRIGVLALQRFIAVRARGTPFGWQLQSPVARHVKDWATRTEGRLQFWYAPGVSPSTTRIRRVAQFVDSVATLFAIATPARLDAYVTPSTEDAQRIIGLDFFPEGSGPGNGYGGRTLPAFGVLLLGDPRVGEAYLHEFVHAVVSPAIPSSNAIFGEGVAVWLGGSHDMSPAETYQAIARYQRNHPSIGIMQVLDGEAPGGIDATDARYGTTGLIVQSVYLRSGIAGLRRLAQLRGSPADILKALSSSIPEFAQPDQWWREEARTRRPERRTDY